MVCCVCGKDVAGLPVMRDNKSGMECCEECGKSIGGPSGFIKYVDSKTNEAPKPSQRVVNENKPKVQKVIIEAETLEEAKSQLEAKAKGIDILSMKIISDGKPQKVTGTADSIEAAYANAESKISDNAKIIEKNQLETPNSIVVVVEAFTEQEAKALAQREIKSKRITAIKLKAAGKKGFMGMGKAPNQYEITEFQPAIGEITYQTKAIISAKIGTDKEYGTCCECFEKIYESEYQNSFMSGLVILSTLGSSYSLDSQKTRHLIESLGVVLQCNQCQKYLCPDCVAKNSMHMHHRTDWATNKWYPCNGVFLPPHL